MMKTKVLVLLALISVSCSKTYNPYSEDPSDPDYAYNRPVGASANDILSAVKYNSLKIELQYMKGFAPDASALDHLRNTVADIINKPGGITIITKEIPASANTVLTIDQVMEVERKNRTVFSTGNQLGIYLLYTDGNFNDDKVLGAAYRNSSMVLFGKKIRDNSGGIGQASRTKLEATVMEHEFGHIMGLVDVGSAMQTNHKDDAHGNHCNNQNCLMNYAAETTDLLGFLITGNIPVFDANCHADLKANGGK